jgi:GTP cyclohydrolase I
MSPNAASQLRSVGCEQGKAAASADDEADVRNCVAIILSALGEDTGRRGIVDTPKVQ